MSTSTALRPHKSTDLPALIHLLEHSFRDDPAYQFLFEDRIEEGLKFLKPRLLSMRIQAGASVLVGEQEGQPTGLLISAPSTLRLGHLSYLRNGLLLAPRSLGVGTTLKLLSIDRELQKLKNLVRPPGMYTELIALAVHQKRQGTGVGSALLHEMLESLDRTTLLVTTNAKNVGFYERFGFRIAVQNGILAGFTAWVMLREP